MSFTITTDVFCDGCSDWTPGVAGSSPKRGSAWALAKRRGWSKEKGKHLCPLCNGRAEYKFADGGYKFKERMK